MSRFGSWFRSTRTTAEDGLAGPSIDSSAKATADLSDAILATALIMNDDIDGAEAQLKHGDSVFHDLGRAVTIFMRSVLGFEKEIMAQAAAKLQECENRAWAEMKKAQRENVTTGRLYSPGTEYALVSTQAQLMAAVVSVMNESVTEGIRGFYKLRKAFVTLDAIISEEARILEAKRNGTNGSAESGAATPSEKAMPGAFDDNEFADLAIVSKPDDDDGDDGETEFVDAKDHFSGTQTPITSAEKLSRAATPDPSSTLGSGSSTPGGDREYSPLQFKSLKLDTAMAMEDDAVFFTSTVDTYIHSGSSLCYGLLLLLISMVPPALNRLLSIVGFKGDRERGVRMLWRSTAVNNINGAMGGLVLLAYYNGLLGQADILPTASDFDAAAEVVGYPTEKCARLLATMRERYPDSRLWRLEESRMLADNRQLKDAITVLTTGEESKMRQVTAINNFELSIDAMLTQDWVLMKSGFLRCLELNDWSHAMYYYMAASAELERYRDAFHAQPRDDTEVRRLKKSAEELFRKCPPSAGRKKLMTRPMPIEVFVLRKVKKFEDRATELGLDMADAVGPSPALEMSYMWNGFKRMNDEQMAAASACLDWNRCTAPAETVEKLKLNEDDASIRTVCLVSILRSQHRYAEARVLLEEVIKLDRALFRGATKDDYALAVAHYEMAVLAWFEACDPELWPTKSMDTDNAVNEKTEIEAGTEKKADDMVDVEVERKTDAVKEFRIQKANECQEWLDKVTKWETFVLDARIGMRVQTGIDVLKWFRKRMGVEA